MADKKIIHIHREAEMLVIARMVEANLHIKELVPWTNSVYIAANILTFLTIAYLVMGVFMAYDMNVYIQGAMLASTMALWLKHAMLSYQLRYYTKQYQRSLHAKESLRKRGYQLKQKHA